MAEAENLYRQILAVQPGHADSLHLLGAIAHQGGRNDLAIELMRQAIAADPSHFAAHSNLASVYLAVGQPGEALAHSRRAIELEPGFADAHYHLGLSLAGLGQIEEAAAAYQRALAINPGHARAANNLGNILRSLGRLDEATEACQRAVQLQPGQADFHSNLGVALAEQGRMEEAAASYRRALQIHPDSPIFHHNLGNALRGAGRWDEVIQAYRRALELRPRWVEVSFSLADILRQRGRMQKAVDAFRHVVRCAPDDPKSWISLGHALQEIGSLGEALVSYRRALESQLDDPLSHCRVGQILQRLGRLDEAAAAYACAIEIRPTHVEAHYWLADVFKEQGRWREARTAMRRVVELAPDVPRAQSDLILVLQTSLDLGEQDVAAEGARWDERFGQPMKQFIQPHRNGRDPDRRLRIGYVSPDFCEHVVGRNMRPLFSHHDHARHEIICFSAGTKVDEMATEFRQRADRWYDVTGMGDEELADLVRREEIDVLVDLALHTAGCRLPMFARQPAPVQVSFAGYPGRTGLETIEYHISDRYLETAPEVERAVLIDSFWCYDPCGVELAVSSSPAEANGFLTFASLNDFSKVNESALKMWAQVLRSVKGSRLMMLRRGGTHLQRTIDLLGEEGIAPERLEFFDPCPRPLYLELYQQADIMLDPFPYNGHTTSLDALWMGLPVVSLAGPRRISRAGLSQLSNLGLAELVAFSEEEYVRIATCLAADLPRLAELRATLRPRMEASVLMDAPHFARQVEGAYRTMWRQWCARQTA